MHFVDCCSWRNLLFHGQARLLYSSYESLSPILFIHICATPYLCVRWSLLKCCLLQKCFVCAGCVCLLFSFWVFYRGLLCPTALENVLSLCMVLFPLDVIPHLRFILLLNRNVSSMLFSFCLCSFFHRSFFWVRVRRPFCKSCRSIETHKRLSRHAQVYSI